MNKIQSSIYNSADQELKRSTLLLCKPVIARAALVDLGCGDCEFTEKLVSAVKPAVTMVVDTSYDRLAIAVEKGYKMFNTDLNMPLPFEDGSIDVIHAGDVIEHLNNTDLFVKEIKRVLSPVGYALISTPNLASWHNVFSLCGGRQPSTCMVSDEMTISDKDADKPMPKHRRIFTFDGLSQLLKFHGLKVTHKVGCGYYPASFGLMTTFDPVHSAYVLVRVVK